MTVDAILDREAVSMGRPVEHCGDAVLRDGEVEVRVVLYRLEPMEHGNLGWAQQTRVVVYANERQLFSAIADSKFTPERQP